MKYTFANLICLAPVPILLAAAWACASLPAAQTASHPVSKPVPPSTTSQFANAKAFDTPQKAADALIDAAEKYDVVALAEIFAPDGDDVVFTGEFAQDRKHAADFATQAREKKSVSIDPKTGNRAFLLVGDSAWPFPVPLVKRGAKWFFDSKSWPAGTPISPYRCERTRRHKYLPRVRRCTAGIRSSAARAVRRKSICPANRQQYR